MTGSSSSSGQSDGLSPATLARVREALRLHLEDRCPDGELGKALQELSSEARTNSVLPENVIVSLRQIFREVERGAPFIPPDTRRTKLEHVVTQAINEYFSSH